MTIQQFSQRWEPGSFQRINQWLADRPQRALFDGLSGSADAFLIADLFKSADTPLFVLVENAKRADALLQECRALVGEEQVMLFPSRDAIPYNLKSPFGPTTEMRLRVLSALLSGTKAIYIAPHSVLLQRLPLPRQLFNQTIRLKVGAEISMESLKTWLQENGFRRETTVEDVGTFSIRGGIFDIYPYNCEHPVRCEFWGDVLDSMREFNVFSQKSLSSKNEVEVLPMREFCFTSEQISQGYEQLARYAESSVFDTRAVHSLDHQWNQVGDLDGIEWYLHWFQPPSVSVLDYLPGSTVVVWDDLLPPARRLEETRANYQRHLERIPEALQPLVSTPQQLLLEDSVIADDLSLLTTVFINTAEEHDAQRYHCDFALQPVLPHNVDLLINELSRHDEQGTQIIVLAPNLGHAERFLELLGDRCPFISIHIGYIQNGFLDRANHQLFYTDNQLFPQQRRSVRRHKNSSAEAIAHFDELNTGDYVVHVDHGIAQFGGIERVKAGDSHQDCMVLLYADKAKLYVPVDDFSRVQKYIGKEGGAPATSKLGTQAWEKLKARTKEALQEMAEELIELYAKRQYLPGIAFKADSTWQKEFEDAFIYDETPDQLRAINEVKKDMESTRPMDRLVCGDVGFGKTEVAMRAAFKAVMSGYQVAVLAPTTILAAQHALTFAQRMANFPVKIGALSRFQKPKEQLDVVQKVNAGQIDILVGTHRILSQDITFKNLGLLIIDEEQRFGVRHKERLKQLRFQVDVLSMSATPIPRTLHMSLLGTRDLSLISTPPRNRLPVETAVREYHDELLKSAIEEELDRGGQVFVVHNRIQNLYLLQEKLEMLVPRARTITAHGQMEEGQLELIMKEFTAGRIDVLLATTIIENGIDIPNVNTIIVNRADALGLSQLYQLRGRVGRSSEQAFAYLLVPSFKSVNEVSLKRLRALEQYTDLGSGFQIAMRDLEIRGAGNILGTEQSGAIAAVGFELYCRLLKESIDELQGKTPQQKRDVKVDCDCEAFIPAEYIGDSTMRINIYQQLSGSQTLGEIQEIQQMLSDRFGPLPPSVMTLLMLMQIKIMAGRLESSRVTFGPDGVMTMVFSGAQEQIKESLKRLFDLTQYHFEVLYEEPLRLKTALASSSSMQRLAECVALLGRVASDTPA